MASQSSEKLNLQYFQLDGLTGMEGSCPASTTCLPFQYGNDCLVPELPELVLCINRTKYYQCVSKR